MSFSLAHHQQRALSDARDGISCPLRFPGPRRGIVVRLRGPRINDLLPLLFPGPLTYREEHRAHFRQPLRLNCRHDIHILFGRHHKLVVHHIIRSVPQTIEGARWVQVTRHACSARHVLSDTLHAGRVAEVGGAYCLPRYVPIRSRACNAHLKPTQVSISALNPFALREIPKKKKVYCGPFAFS